MYHICRIKNLTLSLTLTATTTTTTITFTTTATTTVLLLSPPRRCLFMPAIGCLFVCEQLYAKSYERISMKFSGRVGGHPKRNPLDFGSYLWNADLRQFLR